MASDVVASREGVSPPSEAEPVADVPSPSVDGPSPSVASVVEGLKLAGVWLRRAVRTRTSSQRPPA